jgi:hypothetical protein
MTTEEIAKKARIMVQIRSIIIGLERLEKLLGDEHPGPFWETGRAG